MEPRPFISPRPVSDEPVVRRPITPRSSEDSSIPRAPIIAPRPFTEEMRPIVAKRVAVQAAADDDFILEDEILDEPATSVTLGGVSGVQLQQVAFDLEHRARSATQLEEIVHSSEFGLRYARPKRISVGYLRASKPEVQPAFSEEELQTPHPIIRYSHHQEFGANAFIELADNRYATEMDNAMGVRVDIAHKGMSLCMTKEDDHWVYWPMDREQNVLDYPLLGKVTSELYDAACANTSEEPIVHEYDNDNTQPFVLVMEYLPETENVETGEIESAGKFALAIVVDTDGVTRVVEIPHSEDLFV